MNTNRLTLVSMSKRAAQLICLFMLSGILLFPCFSRAADIDIYSGLTGATGIPNVLIVMDNAANFSSSAAGAGSCTLTNTATGVTATNTLTGTVGGIEQCAFYNVLSGLPTNADGSARVNIGFMVYNANNIADYQNLNCQSANGGCLMYPLQPMTGAARQNMLNWITTWHTSGGAGNGYIKSAGEATAATLQEAWAYYSGNTGLSGRSYAGIQPTTGCQKNFIIFLGNSYSSSGTPGDGGSASPSAALTAAYGAATVPPLILGTQNTSCGSYTFPSSASTHENGGFGADEWTRYMNKSADIFSVSSGRQNIITYTIGVLGASCQASYAALLSSMAAYGGGKYFGTTNDNDIVQALLKILNEVQAVNSVFSSATLPVSVNTQGTYLNQIYMGMFRPDMSGNPRWIGNVKQYQFAFDANKNLYLADATKQAAISSAGTGFITTGAASFWSCANSSRASALVGPPGGYIQYSALPTCPLDPAAGYWQNNADYVANTDGGAFDLPDGEVVEKGGASQQLRLANLTDNYASAPSSPRQMFTYCPSGTGCVAALNDSSNVFATSNANITAPMFGTGINLTVNSITRTGNTATVTTAGTHGLVAGNTITISGATPNDYNGLITIASVTAGNKFTYTMNEYPPASATTVTSGGVGGYVAGLPGAGVPITLTSLVRAVAGTGINATVTATTTTAHGFISGSSVTITGATPANYNLTQNIAVTGSTTFTYPIAVNPTPSPTGSYLVSISGSSLLSISSMSCASSTKVVTVTTSTNHGFLTGDQVTISNDTQSPASKQANGTYTGITKLSATSFTYQAGSCPGTPVGAKVKAGPAAPLAILTLTRNETAVGTATATATIASANQFANGDLVNITLASGTQPANETNYLVSSAVISCASNPCGTTFTFAIATTPATQPSGSGMTAVLGAPSQTISSLTRSFPGGTTATVVLAGGSAGFANGSTVNILTAPGTTLAAHEGAYTGNWVITCVGASPCTTFTYGAVSISPVSPATGSMSASNPGITPDRTTLINWMRGEDNYGDELSPGSPITVRPSVHGDTLHSRPIALNYGGTTGVVVYYGTNDGVYHAINANQTASIGSIAAGGELWGFVSKDFYGKFNRLRTDSPALALPSTPAGIFPTPQPKDYFIDGPTGVYQTIDGNGVTTRAIIYLGERRGGRVLQALDVTDPVNPKYLWGVSNATPGFNELGQTWSLPKVARVRGYANPVLIFGAGYDDGSEDNEPPVSATDNGWGDDTGADTMGRGLFILDAFDGHIVWQATHYSASGAGWPYYWYRFWTAGGACTGTAPAAVVCQVPAMNYSIPADVTLMDQDQDGYIDRLYATDSGGNIWRMDFEPVTGNTPNSWQITQLAALGCTFGACDMQLWSYPSYANPVPTQRKFFFPVEVIGATSKNNYDAVFIGSGDREHPLQMNQSYGVSDRMYLIKDFNTSKDSVSQVSPITETGVWGASTSLDDCTGTRDDPTTPIDETAFFCTAATTGAAGPLSYDQLTATQQHSGYYINFRTGEKVVNAPLVTAGYIYFGSNQPTVPNPLSCTTNLGIARGYQLSPFSAKYGSTIFDGGGLPPSPVSGIVDIINSDGTTTQAAFCVGCATPLSSSALGGGSGTAGPGGCDKSALEGCKPKIDVNSNRKRNYWYIDNK